MRHRTYFRDGIGRKGNRRYQPRVRNRHATRGKSAASEGLSAARAASWSVRRSHVMATNLTSDTPHSKGLPNVAAFPRSRVRAHQRPENTRVADDHTALPENLSELRVRGVKTKAHAEEPCRRPAHADQRRSYVGPERVTL